MPLMDNHQASYRQLRVEEKSYLKEVKRSIAEGRVPQVRLKQNNNGDIVQYKAQFLNALKLADTIVFFVTACKMGMTY
jgi:hypothetical protein